MNNVWNRHVKISCCVADAGDLKHSALFIHGMNANLAFWHPLLVRRLGNLRQTIRYDQRGHGNSDVPQNGYTSVDLAGDAVVVLDQFNIERVDIVAHSFGATVALQLARLFPERVNSLVILDGRVRLLQQAIRLIEWSQFRRWHKHFLAANINIDSELEMDFQLPLSITPDQWNKVRASLSAEGFFVPSNGRRAFDKYFKLMTETTAMKELKDEAGLTIESLRNIQAPVLSIFGSFSPYLPTFGALQKLLPDSQSALIPDVGHNFPLMAPERTAQLIRNFWCEIVAGARI